MRELRSGAVLLALFLLWGSADAWAGPPTDQLKGAVERVIRILDDPALKADGRARERRAAVRAVADEFFDFPETARRALGRHWRKLTAEEQAEFVRLFAALLERGYIGRIDRYSGERVVFGRETLDGGFATVSTKVVLKQGREASVDYRMHRPGDRWLVYDVVVEGISLVANYRVQFNKIIETSSYQALIAQLRAKHREEARLDAEAGS